jgi:putative FmdB family regulatory protein
VGRLAAIRQRSRIDSLDPVGGRAYRFFVHPVRWEMSLGGQSMPTYEYVCGKCRKRFSVIKSISEHDRRQPMCPKCKSRKVTQIFTPFYAKTVKKS